jgi:hypothetical protein
MPDASQPTSNQTDAEALPTQSPSTPEPGDATEKPNRRWLKRLAFLLYMVVLAELGSRTYFSLSKDLSFVAPNMEYVFYIELKPLLERLEPISAEDNVIDVLVLGGSVLHHESGDIKEVLEERLAKATGQSVVIHNMAMPGHTSRDSYFKYRHLTDHRFDLVLYYHGINEARMNNCSAEAWRDDYTHAGWHARHAAIQSHPELPLVVFPYASHYLWIKLCAARGIGGMIPGKWLNDSSLEYGDNIRSDAALKANLSAVLDMAKSRGDRIMVLSFATYLPKGYDLDRPGVDQPEGVDDYSHNKGKGSQLEMWGRARHVMAAVARHNVVIRTEKAGRSGVTFYDMAQQYPADGELYDDICHYSSEGCRRYVDLIFPTILKIVQSDTETNPSR